MNSVLSVALTAAVLATPIAQAQSGIAGQVKDAKGGALQGVTVVALIEQDPADLRAAHLLHLAVNGGGAVGGQALMERRRWVVTDAKGKYTIPDLPPGKYSLLYTAPRFRALRRTGVQVRPKAVAPVDVALAPEQTVQPAVQPTVQDQYSAIVEWQQPSGDEVLPIHVSLLPNGSLFFMEPIFGMVPTPYNVPPPAAVQIAPMQSPVPPLTYDPSTGIQTGKYLTCAGHALMDDGNLFFSGGTYVHWNVNNPGKPPQGAIVEGIVESKTYNTVSNTWASNPDSGGTGAASGRPLRWYPTVTRLADSKMMLTGGYETVFPTFGHNRSVDVFDPARKSWATLSGFADTPDGIANPDYTHVFQSPASAGAAQAVLVLGGSAEPMLLVGSGTRPVWRRSGKLRPGAQQHIDNAAPAKVVPNQGSSSAMLPIRLPESGWGYANGSLINVGGDESSLMEGNVDVYDPGSNAWRPSIPMNGRRHYPTATILPDGRILILAGHAPVGDIDQTGHAEYIDPKNGFAHTVGMARMPEVRGYHAMAILLPDGRVMVGGGNDDGGVGTEKPNFRYYYPDYMFKPRPEIVSVQPAIKINTDFPVLVPHRASVDEVALLALGSMTHSFDMGQRSVQLRLQPGHRTLKVGAQGELEEAGAGECLKSTLTCYDKYLVQAPTSRELAPPGHHMLFVLDRDRVPSLGKMVRLVP